MSASILKRLRFQVDLWCSARITPLRVYRRSFEEILSLAPLSGPQPYRGMDAAYICRRVRRTTRRPLFMRDRRCLRQGLLGFRFLREAGFLPELRFGIDGASVGANRIKAHCWVCLDGKPVISDREENMVEIHVHGPPETGEKCERLC